ncbi:MAG TPA: hypothetical protein VEC12_08785 [Bacteroidia bacterium]|nr:hypothetical protein [Bacteroidia bacterium]
MSNTVNPQGNTDLSLWQRMRTKEFWQQQNNWLFVLIVILVATVIVYIVTHSLEAYTDKNPKYWDDPHEAEFKKMDPKDISYLTSLINEGSTNIKIESLYSLDNDTAGTPPIATTSIRFKDNPNCPAVKEYIKQQLPYVYPQDTQKLFPLLEVQPNSLAVAFIESAKFRVKSYFWLAGPHTYFEVIFWTIFGVITSILFYIAVAISNGTGFRPEEIPGHLAKIVYSPFISLIIIFAYNYISNPDSMVDVSASKATLIISFLLGFYSSRAMKLLDKLKDVFLPYGDTTTADDSKRKADVEAREAAQNTTVTADVSIIDPQHPDAEEMNAHISQAIVTITPTGGGNPITLQKTGDDELDGKFAAENVPPGSYTLAATLTTTDGINYTGQTDINVPEGENIYNLTMTRGEENG